MRPETKTGAQGRGKGVGLSRYRQHPDFPSVPAVQLWPTGRHMISQQLIKYHRGLWRVIWRFHRVYYISLIGCGRNVDTAFPLNGLVSKPPFVISRICFLTPSFSGREASEANGLELEGQCSIRRTLWRPDVEWYHSGVLSLSQRDDKTL